MKITRRELLTGAATIGSIALVSSKSLLQAFTNESTATPSLSIIPFGSPQFAQLLETHFPDLGVRKRFKKIQSSAAIVTNTGTEPIKGVTLQWTLVDTNGQAHHYTRTFIRRPSVQLVKRQYSAESTFLAPNQSALATPLFFWPASAYAAQPAAFRIGRKQLLTYSTRYPKARNYTRMARHGPPVTVNNTAIVLEDRIVGSAPAKVIHALRNQQNGEHDEARLFLSSIRSVPGDSVAEALKQAAQKSQRIRSYKAEHGPLRTYFRSRVNFANKVFHAASVMPQDQLIAILDRISAVPRSVYL